MKKLIGLLVVLFSFYIIVELAFYFLSKGYTTEYKLNGFKVTEVRTKNTKDEIDNYYFELKKDDKVFSIQTLKGIANSQKVIKEIKYFKDDNYECVLPITKTKTIISDIICEDRGVYYNYDSLVGKDDKLDDFAKKYLEYRDTFNESDEILKSDSNLDIYDNFEDNMYLGLEYYKGVYLLNKKDGYRNYELFDKDVYKKEISTFIKGNYVVADYNEKYEFHDFYVINIKTYKKYKITSNNAISAYSYVQGVVGDSVYIIDTANKIQYELNIKTRTVTEIGNEEFDIKVYKDGNWTLEPIYNAIEKKLYFETVNKKFKDKEYARVDKIGNEASGYYYIYEKKGSKYNVYKVNVQNTDIMLYLFSTDNISNPVYKKDQIYYKDGTFIKYYSDLTGVKKLAKYDEVSFNNSLKFNIKG